MRMEVSGVLSSCEDIADEIGLLARERELVVQAADNEPAADDDGQHEHGDEQAEDDVDDAGCAG